MSDQSGLIIYFDGPDGVGKTSQLELVFKSLVAAGYRVYKTRTMGGTPIGELLRTALLSGTDRPAETDLHIAMASQYALAPDILARRDDGEIVLVDRSPLSIIGYQVFGDGLDIRTGYKAVGKLLGLVEPDLIVTFYAKPESLVKRRSRRNHHVGADHFENKPLEYHEKVAEGFATASHHFGGKPVDANGPVDDVHKQTMSLIQQLLKT